MEVHQNEDILALHQLTNRRGDLYIIPADTGIEELQSMKDEALRDISDLERLVFRINHIMETRGRASLWDDMANEPVTLPEQSY